MLCRHTPTPGHDTVHCFSPFDILVGYLGSGWGRVGEVKIIVR